MRIDRLRLVNFRQHEDTELVLGPGLTGIVGPNGAGKTTLLEAIAFAIYGTPAARGNRDTIRRRRAGGRAQVRVELDFTLGPHRYQVTRSLGNAELRQDGDPAPIATSLGAVTERLTRLLGMTREEFFNTYFTGQKELAVMAAMSAPERAQFLSRVLGYERLRSAQERLRERRSVLRARHQTLEGALTDTAELEVEEQAAAARLARAGEACTTAEAALAAADSATAGLRPRLETMRRLKEAVAELHGELRLADHKVTETRDRHEQLDRQLAEAIGARDRLAGLSAQLEPLSQLKQEIALLDTQEKAVAARQGYEAQLADLRARQRTVLERLAQLPAPDLVRQTEQELDRLQTAHSALAARAEEMRTGWVRDVQEAKTKRQTLLDQYQDIREQRQRITAAGEDGACPTCRRPLGDEYGNVLAVLQRQLEEVTLNGSFYKQRIEQLETSPPDLQAAERERDDADREIRALTERLAQLRTQAREEKSLRDEQQTLSRRIGDLEQSLAASAVPYDAERHAARRREVAGLDAIALEAARLKSLAERAEALVQEAEVVERTLSEREQQARELRERLLGMGYREEAFAALQRESDQAEEARRQAELAVVRARAERGAAEEALAAAGRRRDERRRREAEAREVAAELAMYNELDRAFTDLRTDLNATLRPDLSELASAFLRDMTAGRYPELELDEDYVPAIVDEGERKVVISGGEEDVANLALRLAISQMIAERAGQPLSLLVLDEIFGSLDEERRSGVLELLRGLADRFPQVVLITHIEGIRDGFDRVIRVDFDLSRGSSEVRDEPGGRDGLAA